MCVDAGRVDKYQTQKCECQMVRTCENRPNNRFCCLFFHILSDFLFITSIKTQQSLRFRTNKKTNRRAKKSTFIWMMRYLCCYWEIWTKQRPTTFADCYFGVFNKMRLIFGHGFFLSRSRRFLCATPKCFANNSMLFLLHSTYCSLIFTHIPKRKRATLEKTTRFADLPICSNVKNTVAFCAWQAQPN